MSDRLQSDADDILGWLNVHCVKLSEGTPAAVLQQRWTASQREPEGLRQALEWLFAEDLVSLTPGLDSPHVRVSASGYQRLLAAADAVRQPLPAAAAVADPELGSTPTPRPKPTPVASNSEAAATALDPGLPARFLAAGKPLTEIGLRNQLLYVYRDLKMQAGHQIVAMTLSRYWQELGLRTGDLRLAIDLLVRDGYLRYSSFRHETHWLLTEAGHAYASAAITPAPLLALARPLGELRPALGDETLRRTGIALFSSNPAELRSIRSLEQAWPHDHDSLLHGLDLLWKADHIELRVGDSLGVALTAEGQVYCLQSRRRFFGLRL